MPCLRGCHAKTFSTTRRGGQASRSVLLSDMPPRGVPLSGRVSYIIEGKLDCSFLIE